MVTAVVEEPGSSVRVIFGRKDDEDHNLYTVQPFSRFMRLPV
jgi:hypothetical protein